MMQTRIAIFLLTSALAFAQGGKMKSDDLVEFELMTWPEVKRAIHELGKTTALIYNGGTEQRGPQCVNGGHNYMGRATAMAIAKKLGNAVFLPVLPYSVNRANAELPGTIGLTGAVFSAINENIAEEAIKNGFKNVVLMGDHGGGQKELGDLAKKLDAKYAGQGVRVVYCDEVYSKANRDFDDWLADNKYPKSSHAGIPDTSELLYLMSKSKVGKNEEPWVRKELVATAIGDPVRAIGEARDPNAKRVNNGISGDGRRSTAELGERLFNMKVDYAVGQIPQLLAAKP